MDSIFKVRVAVLSLGLAASTAVVAGTPALLPTEVAAVQPRVEQTIRAAVAPKAIADIEASSEFTIRRISISDSGPAAAQQLGTLKLAAIEAGTPLAVIYPDIGEPYRGVFAKIIEGIEEKTKARVVSFPVSADVNAQTLAADLRRLNIKVVIVLGRHGLKVASALDRDIGVVAGGVISAPETEGRMVQVLSLAPDPGLLFGQLKRLMPGARRVYVVYDPQHNAWLMRHAREAAAAHGVELVAREAQDLKTAMRHYQDILGSADPKQDTLWLPQDSTTVEESSVLPLVLQRAWDRSLLVFSSNLAHVRRGALFALYPDNVALGRNLANSAMGYLASGTQERRGVLPLKDVLVAANLRTANHLGLQLSYAQQRRFDLVFPQQ